MEHSRTVIETKSAFLRQQIRLLSATVQPSSTWKENAPPADGPELGDKVINEVLTKLNAKVKQHNRLAYSAESTRHVAEQIDVLYWNAISKAGDGSDLYPESGLLVNRNADLTTIESIHSLPDSLQDVSPPSDASQHYTEHDAEIYDTAHARLMDLSQRRSAAQAKLAQLKNLKRLLDPYLDPQSNIQPNLVTRNGELGKELDRMRVLLARVTGAIQQNEAGQATGQHSSEDMSGDTVTATDVGAMGPRPQSERQKLDEIMDLT